jgi:hypothetical protein
MRIPTHIKLTLALTAALSIASPGIALAAEAPVKEVLSSRIGWNINKTKEQEGAPQAERNICTVASKDECQLAAASGEPGGFELADGVAVDNAPALVSPERGDVYVADKLNARIQVFSPAGAFVLMFGREVNKTTKGNVCTAESKDVCQAGTKGVAAGQFTDPRSVTIDPATGNIYVEEKENSPSFRVQEFTATGEFVLMIGKDVNETTKGNLCTAESKDKCKGGEQAQENNTELGAFDFEESAEQLLAVGGPENLLYVGDLHRVEIFKTDGTPVGEISLRSIAGSESSGVQALTVSQAGDVYVAYTVGSAGSTVQTGNLIYEFGPSGQLLQTFELGTRGLEAVGVEVAVTAIALDSAGRLEVSEQERGKATGTFQQVVVLRGTLYEVKASKLRLLTEGVYEGFPAGNSVSSVAFNGEDDMYIVGGNEVRSYAPVPVGELSASAPVCSAGSDSETGATVDCELEGVVNPWGVPGTEVWFQWGKTPAYGTVTPHKPVTTGEALVDVSGPLTGLLPDETYFYRVAGEDQNVRAPELLSSEGESFVTPSVAPRIVGEPSVLHAGAFSVVLFGELNPENTNTTYRFQYGVCEDLENCPGALETPLVQSPTYGTVGTTVEAAGLLAGTVYHYRLLADNEHEVANHMEGGQAASVTGEFTTAPGPAVSAQTGAVSAVGSTSAVISGVVNPDGEAAAYTFELGRYTGAATQFGIVLTAPAGAGSSPVVESLALSGLQPGTTYAYRISAHSGDGSAKGQSATGAMLTFTTAGLPAVLSIPSPLAQLPAPSIAFPTLANGAATLKKTNPKCKRGQQLSHGRCVKSKPRKKAKRARKTSRSQRAER